jgi:hypothetical protein
VRYLGIAMGYDERVRRTPWEVRLAPPLSLLAPAQAEFGRRRRMAFLACKRHDSPGEFITVGNTLFRFSLEIDAVWFAMSNADMLGARAQPGGAFWAD